LGGGWLATCGHACYVNAVSGVDTLLSRLDLETLDRDLFRGNTPNDGRPRVFGGLVAAQALIAACRTVAEPDRLPHSLHGYFLRPGDPTRPIIYSVDRIRDGSSFSTRRVVARQNGEAIFNMATSFHVPEDGLEHQIAMPPVPDPETLKPDDARLREHVERTGNPVFAFLLSIERPIEHRDADPVDLAAPEPHRTIHRRWFRAVGRIPDDPRLHMGVLTYASDMGLLDSSLDYHGLAWVDPAMMVASLDHAVWFHRPFRADDWLLYVTDSPTTAGGRGMNFGRIYARDGSLVASTAQESLIRKRTRRAGR
jgi:acyl-CoA thioesterase II